MGRGPHSLLPGAPGQPLAGARSSFKASKASPAISPSACPLSVLAQHLLLFHSGTTFSLSVCPSLFMVVFWLLLLDDSPSSPLPPPTPPPRKICGLKQQQLFHYPLWAVPSGSSGLASHVVAVK